MGNKRERLLEEAKVQFIQRGYHGTSVKRVAMAAGIAEAYIINNFGSKDGMLKAVIEYGKQKAQELIGPIVLESNPAQRIINAHLFIYDIPPSEYGFWRLLFTLKLQNHDFQEEILVPLRESMTLAYQKLGYSKVSTRVDDYYVFLHGLTKKIILDKGFDKEEHKAFTKERLEAELGVHLSMPT